MRWIFTLTLILSVAAPGFAATLYVPDDFASIQGAIDASSDGDLIIVRPGTYVENIDFLGKAITLKSELGPCDTIIDGNKSGSVVTFKNGEVQDSILDGFTLTNGSGTWGPPSGGQGGTWVAGGGIYCDGADPIITNNIIAVNTAETMVGSNKGGGISCFASNPIITNNIFHDNWARGGSHSTGHGGAIYCEDSSPTITNNTLTWNQSQFGGGISCSNSFPIITNTIIWKNFASHCPEISGSVTEVTYCNVKDGSGQPWFGEGCIDAKPCFLDSYSQGDFHILQFSPCRNAGTKDAPFLPNKDFEGDDRILEDMVDIGADEFSTPHGSSGTYHVPGDYPTIQEAIESAYPWDTIVVAPGTYYENIHFRGKAITLMSSDGPKATVINGTKSGCVVLFDNWEESDSVLEGFKLTNGTAGIYCCNYSSPVIRDNLITVNKDGGGINCRDASPAITNNTIKYNSAGSYPSYGGGIRCVNSSPLIADNSISNNSATHGGGIYSDPDSYPIITGNTINKNTSQEGAGGGICCGDVLITENIITNNSAKYGGGINGGMTITNNLISGNSAWDGGGIIAGSGGEIIQDNIICDNVASWDGGGIHCKASNFGNNIIANNSAEGSEGGGLYIEGDSTITNNTIINNSAIGYYGGSGGGIHCGGTITITNTILWGNTADTGPEIWTDATPLTISYSDVQDGQYAVHVGPGATLNWGDGMIDADPLFLEHPEVDCHLSFASPCIDAGDNNALSLPAVDFEGDPRIFPGNGKGFRMGFPLQGAVVDMGADEYCLMKIEGKSSKVK
jgi:hypothetical protein